MISILDTFIRHHSRLVKFLISGGTATLTNLVVVYVLTDVFQVFYLVSSGIAFVTSFTVSFTLQKFWTFSNPSLDVVHRQLIISLIVAGCNLFINIFLMYCFVDKLGIHYLAGQLMTSALIACETFFLYKHVIFIDDPKFFRARR